MVAFDLINLFVVLVMVAVVAGIPATFLYYFRRLVLSYEKRTNAIVEDEEEFEEPVAAKVR